VGGGTATFIKTRSGLIEFEELHRKNGEREVGL